MDKIATVAIILFRTVIMNANSFTREACIQDPYLIGILISSNLIIWGSYQLISGVIIWVLSWARKVPFPAVWWLFAIFISACGWTHFCSALVFFRIAYNLEAAVCAFTAIISCTTAVLFFMWRTNILNAVRGYSKLTESIDKTGTPPLID